MKKRVPVVPALAALAALFLAPLAEASLARTAPPANEPPALTLASPAPEPSGFSLFDGHELASSTNYHAPSFHPLAAISLLPEDARLDLASERDASYPKTRVWAIDVLGSTLVSRSSDLSLETHWACGDFSCGLVSGGRKDPLGLVTFIRAESGGPADVVGTVNVETGVTALDYTLFAGLNTTANFVNRFVNAGANALYFMGRGQAALEDALKKYTGASEADIEFLKIYAVTNPAEVAAAMSSLRASAEQAGARLEQLLARIKTAREEAQAAGGMAHPERGAFVPGGGRRPPLPSDLRKYRRATPSDEIRGTVNASAVKADAAYGTVLEKAEAGHLISADEIMRDPRFARLTDPQRRQILNLPENFVPLSRGSNASQGNRVPSAWPGHSQLGPLPAANRQELERLEGLARQAVEGAFARMLGQQ